MSAADHDLQMDLDFARADLYYEFGSSLSWAATGEANPMFRPKEYVTARQYLRQTDLSLQDPTFRPAPSWSLREREGLVWEDKFVFPMSPMKAPVQMIRTTHLSAVREVLINNRLECAKVNARIPFDTVAGIIPVCLSFKMICSDPLEEAFQAIDGDNLL